MRNAAQALLTLALFCASAWIGIEVLGPELSGRGSPHPKPPPTPKAPALPGAFRARVAQASGLEAGRLLSEAFGRYAGQPVEDELRRLIAKRSARANAVMRRDAAKLLESYRYRSAAALVEQYRTAWEATGAARAMAAQLADLREEQAGQVTARKQEADTLFRAGRYEGARETLKTGWELEEPYRRELADYGKEIERRIEIHSASPGAPPALLPGPSAPPPAPRRVLAAPPALPGYPHPDINRLSEARALLAKAHSLSSSQRYQATIKAVADLLGYFGDLAYVKRNREALDAMSLLARHGMRGAAGLFHAASIRSKGSRVKLVYDFKSPDQLLDWEQEATIPHPDSGKFEAALNGVRGTGAMSYLLRAFFNNDVSLSCKARIQARRTHGLAFCQAGLESRQILLLATNHWFVEGENYVKERRGHSLLMIGKGTNNDVPVDSPEIGFVFKGATHDSPRPPAGATLSLTFSVRGDRMVGRVGYRSKTATLTYHTKGDDGRSIDRLRPALFVVQNGVLFSEVVIEGTLHTRFARERVNELLDLASMLGD